MLLISYYKLTKLRLLLTGRNILDIKQDNKKRRIHIVYCRIATAFGHYRYIA